MAAQGVHTLQTQDVVIDFLEGRVLAPRAADGRKLPSGHECAIYSECCVGPREGSERNEGAEKLIDATQRSCARHYILWFRGRDIRRLPAPDHARSGAVAPPATRTTRPAGSRPTRSDRFRSRRAERSTQSRGGGSRPVSRVLSKAAIHLRRTSPHACSDLPGSGAGHASSPMSDALPYLVLLRVGFTLPPVLPPARCALTAPFHPCLASSRTSTAHTARAVAARSQGGLFSVALSVGSRPPGVTWHPALRSPDFPPPRVEAATARSTPAGHSVTRERGVSSTRPCPRDGRHRSRAPRTGERAAAAAPPVPARVPSPPGPVPP